MTSFDTYEKAKVDALLADKLDADGTAAKAAALTDAGLASVFASSACTEKENELIARLAPEYSETSKYSVGDFCSHDGYVYQCTTAIATGGEAWTASHWAARDLSIFLAKTIDRYGNKTAITIGTRNGSATNVGGRSFTQGENLIAQGNYSHAEGRNTNVYGDYSHGEGRSTTVNDAYAWAWNGKNEAYTSHGEGTFSVNPVGGVDGIYVGSETLPTAVFASTACSQHDAYSLQTNVAQGDNVTIEPTDAGIKISATGGGMQYDSETGYYYQEIETEEN